MSINPTNGYPAGLKADRAIDTDKLAMVSRYDAGRIANGALFPIQQTENPEELVLGIATLFAAVTLRANLPASTLYEMGKRVLNAPFDGDAPTDNGLQTLKDWVGLKVMAQEVTIG